MICDLFVYRFLPALLTAVLMYHLAWVPTVMPSNHPPIKPIYEKHSSHSLDLLAKSHPYNPLWAQLGIELGYIEILSEASCLSIRVVFCVSALLPSGGEM